VGRLAAGAAGSGPLAWLWLLGGAFVEVNLVLMFFNLIPIRRSTDRACFRCSCHTRGSTRTTGSAVRVSDPHRAAVGVPAVFHVDLIGAYFRHTVDPLFKMLVPR